MALLPEIEQRESKRSFLPDPVPPSMLQDLLEALRWAPSCRNYQPWRVVAVESHESLAKLAQCLAKGNEWAAKAPLAFIVSADPKDDATIDGKEYYLFDCGLAVQNLLIQATALGLCSHPTAGWNEESLKKTFAISENQRVLCVVFLGFPGSLADLDTETRAKDETPRIRKPLEEWARFV
ncbi:nitroreductase family protein [Heliobacterium chlorum]|uniref:Nitroreductase family protein n=1 Tax=Heliobacterium chlorum TaxID=2698 RepID=A0ABR7T240_HELCL|nr:nitroreductase family protein [Heliobacterium chlorum]MBC9784726.1 nitroreductase family protein [Heliobacterium chlorum]